MGEANRQSNQTPNISPETSINEETANINLQPESAKDRATSAKLGQTALAAEFPTPNNYTEVQDNHPEASKSEAHPDHDDFNGEDYAEIEAMLESWERTKKFRPIFQADVKTLLDANDEFDIHNPDCPNFLINGKNLSELVAITENNDEAQIDLRMILEKTIDTWAEEQGMSLREMAETPDELADQLLAISLKRTAEEYQNNRLTEEQFQTSLHAINNLGLKIPLEANYFNIKEFNGLTRENYQLCQQFQKLGIINEDFYESSRQMMLDHLFTEQNLPIPEALQNPTEAQTAYWDQLSEKIGANAFSIYYAQISSYVYIQNRRSPISPAIYFNENAQPTPIAFIDDGPLNNAIWRWNSSDENLSEIQAFVSEFSDQLSPTHRFCFEALTKINHQEYPNLHNHFLYFSDRIRDPKNFQADWFESTAENQDLIPTEKFWQRLNSPDYDLGIITLFPDYEKHYSQQRVTAAHFPDQLREDLAKYMLNYKPFLRDDAAAELLDNIFDETGAPNPWVFQDPQVLNNFQRERFIKHFPDQLPQYFDPTELAYLNLPEGYRIMLQNYAEQQADNQVDFDYHELITKVIQPSGPTDELFQLAFDERRVDLLCGQPLIPIEDLPFTPNQHYIIQKYQEILSSNQERGIELGQEYLNAIAQVDLQDLTFEQIDSITDIVNRVTTSNAIELRRAGKDFLHEVVKSDHPEAKLDQIEQVFLHNNLPYAGKVFRSFQILYPAEQSFDHQFASAVDHGVLKNLPDTGLISRESVLFADLIKASIGSNNRSMRQYINNLRQGQQLVEQLLQANQASTEHATSMPNIPDYDQTYDDLSPTEQSTLKTYLEHVETLYNQTQKGQRTPYISANDLEQDLINLSANFNASERFNLPDRIVRSFCYMLGIHSLDELEQYMDNAISSADAKNRARYEQQDFTLQENDLVKAVEAQYLDNILQNGAICKEFLNGETSSDSTPLDADLTRLGAECTGDINLALNWKNAHAAFSAMALNLVIKDSDLIQTDGTKYDPSKLELWDNGNSNCGIRTGFPSSAIDFIVYDQSSVNAYSETTLPFICAEIAKNGFYIPIVDKASGKCVFSPQEYDNLRRKLSGLEHYGASEFQFATDADLYTPGINTIIDLVNEQDTQVAIKRQAIETELSQQLTHNFADFKGIKSAPDGDLTPGFVELIDTGSTSRGTSIPDNKIDFDFIMRVDATIYNNPVKYRTFTDTLRQGLHAAKDNSNLGGIRLDGVEIAGLEEPVKLDISFTQRTNHLEFSTDQALAERLKAIKQQSPERYSAVIANIILAKQLLKNANVYKPKHSSEELDPDRKGGLGGVGIENWILQNGGSLKAAAEDFLTAANQANYDFNKFRKIYQIWDAGQNHFAVRDNETSGERRDSFSHTLTYDNFVARNMDAEGFARMTTALRQYLDNIA